MIGKTISHYKILEELGRGGMGVVYKAEDTKLQRIVALKFLPVSMTRDERARERFVHEARAASALDHPNICTIHEIDETEEGNTFIVMAYYEGETLKEKIERGPLEIEEALDIVCQISEGLHEAHEKEIVHRDIKPANIALTTRDQVKIMDFGLAKLRGQTILTREGTTLGTVSYMSPEQARGEEVDHRTDIWSLGVVLYEMITGKRPFKGDYEQAVIYSILNEDPETPSSIRKDIPLPLEGIILQALKKEPADRFQSVREFQRALVDSGIVFRAAYRGGAAGSIKNIVKRPAVLIPVLLAIFICVFLAVRYVQHTGKVRWATQEVLPTVLELVEGQQLYEAYELALQIRDIIPSNPILAKAWDEINTRMTIITEPPGALISIKQYRNPDGEWIQLGRTPLGDVEVPWGFHRWIIQKDDYAPVEVARATRRDDTLKFILDESSVIPDGMVRVSGGRRYAWLFGINNFITEELPDFYIDRYEVTNRQFQVFVNEGGYQRREFWKHDFLHEGHRLAWDEAMDLFRDKTGRPGPATWELGTYPDGKEDYPVTGVSWFEAAAYAEFAGKSLPSIHHWLYTAALNKGDYIIPFSNFSRDESTPVGSSDGLGLFGEYDIAGNAREWCFNTAEGDRYILGGCWNDPIYMFNFTMKLSPFDRSFCNGFRCIQLINEQDGPKDIWRDVLPEAGTDYRREEPVDDAIFKAYRSLYEYEKTPLRSEVVFIDDEPEHWTIEKISFDAAYGRERMFVYLFIPRGVSPPYQTVVYFPGAEALSNRSSQNGGIINYYTSVNIVVRSGRAALFPVYKATFERGDGYNIFSPEVTQSEHNAHILLWWKDLSRSLDYLETRKDIDLERIAYIGGSMGAWLAPIFLAQDNRYRVAVLTIGGLLGYRFPPAFDTFNFLPRVRIPVLMVNGRYDHLFPHETSQVPMFETLGTPPEDKRHVIFDTAHNTYGHRNEVIREVLDWLDKYLGPVEQ